MFYVLIYMSYADHTPDAIGAETSGRIWDKRQEVASYQETKAAAGGVKDLGYYQLLEVSADGTGAQTQKKNCHM